MNHKKIFNGLVFLQVLFIFLVALTYYTTEWFGTEIRLKTAPVDPRDILYGDYVTLNYDISTLSASLIKEDFDLEKEKNVYVVVHPGQEYYTATGIYPSKPILQSGEVAIQGQISYVQNEYPQNGKPIPKTIRIKYGFERYYVPEGTGLDLEKKRGLFAVKVKVSSWGQKISSLDFIATDVMLEGEIRDVIEEKYEKSRNYVWVEDIQLVSSYLSHPDPVWIAQVNVEQKGMNQRLEIILDAKTGNIIEEKAIKTATKN